MAAYGSLIFLLLGALLYTAFAARLSAWSISLPMVFVALGWAVGAGALDVMETGEIGHVLHILAEVTLVLVLFSDASTVSWKSLRANLGLPLRMLLIAMPLTILFGTAIIYFNPLAAPVPLAVALLTAAILTPTDLALAQPIAEDKRFPLKVRQSITVESGLNDGLAFPAVFTAALLATAASASTSDGSAPTITDLFQSLTLGPLAGVAVGVASALLLKWCIAKRMAGRIEQGIFALCVALIAYFSAQAIGGNGFIAAFVAGLAFGNTVRGAAHAATHFMEGEGKLLTMASFLVLGAVLLPLGLSHANPGTIFVAVCMLTIVRILPVVLSLAGTGLGWTEKLTLGWFGPRGLASILFTLIVMEQFDVPGIDELIACVTLTVTLSIFLHGLSTQPVAAMFAKRADK